MKVLTLSQPWASFLAAGIKKVETRSWETSFRGRFAIHASKQVADPEALKRIMRSLSLSEELPYGVIIGTAELFQCVPIEMLEGTMYDTRIERLLGDWSPGRYGWIMQYAITFNKPIPARGHSGFWEWDKSLILE
jgi:hypothetical protein